MPRRVSWGPWLVILIVLAVAFATGCAVTQDQRMIAVERAVEAGSALLDAAIDTQIDVCESRKLATESERASCVDAIARLNDAAEPALLAAVSALRAYWISRASADEPGINQARASLQAAIDALPAEYFAGLRELARGL